MDKPKVSVIVPVYNTEKYLSYCLESILSQTFKDLEIIIVNDESPDNSIAIINDYASRYDNIKVVDKKNGGLAEARRSGVLAASGDYIMHVDSDDWLPLNAIEILYDKCVEHDLDFAKGVLYVYYSDNYAPICKHLDPGFLNGREFLEYSIRVDDGLPSTSSLCRRSIWQQDIFPPRHLKLPSEDFFISLNMWVHIKKAAIFNELPVYYYRQLSTSLSHGSLAKSQDKWALFYSEARRSLRKNNILEEMEERLRLHEVDKFAFHISDIDKNDEWYKAVCNYDSSNFPRKYKLMHFLIKYPALCHFVVRVNRNTKSLYRRFRK